MQQYLLLSIRRKNNMKKELIIFGIAVLLILIVGFCGCTEVRSFTCDDKLLGSWRNTVIKTEIIMFYPDGTWASMGSDGTWTVEDDKLIITTYNPEGKIDYIYNYSFSKDNKLTLTRSNGISKVYLKL